MLKCAREVVCLDTCGRSEYMWYVWIYVVCLDICGTSGYMWYVWIYVVCLDLCSMSGCMAFSFAYFIDWLPVCVSQHKQLGNMLYLCDETLSPRSFCGQARKLLKISCNIFF